MGDNMIPNSHTLGSLFDGLLFGISTLLVVKIQYTNQGGLECDVQGPLGDNRKIFRYSNGDRIRDPKRACPTPSQASALPLKYRGSLQFSVALHIYMI